MIWSAQTSRPTPGRSPPKGVVTGSRGFAQAPNHWPESIEGTRASRPDMQPDERSEEGDTSGVSAARPKWIRVP